MRTLDIHALKAELRATATQLKDMKKERRNPPGGYSCATLSMKKTATILCAIRASHRGKTHLKDMPFNDQEMMIREERQRFVLKPVASAA